MTFPVRSADGWYAPTERALRRAGWRPGRRTDIGSIAVAYAQEHVELSLAAEQVLSEFGGLTVRPRRRPENRYWVEPIRFFEHGDDTDLRASLEESRDLHVRYSEHLSPVAVSMDARKVYYVASDGYWYAVWDADAVFALGMGLHSCVERLVRALDDRQDPVDYASSEGTRALPRPELKEVEPPSPASWWEWLNTWRHGF